MDEKLLTLKKYFGYDTFREGQQEVIDNILKNRDVLCIMPTGAGKSVCYQVPALMFDGVTIVVSPLISLMKDQVQFLVSAGVRAAYVNSSLSQQVIEKVMVRIKGGVYKIIYVAPERLVSFAFKDAISELKISQIIIDEAHCISKWGHDFRPSYLGIIEFIDSLNYRPEIAAFTATATEQVKKDICTALKLKSPFIKISSFDRPNLYFDVRRPKDKDKELISILKNKWDESGIVYCSTRKVVEEVCQMLNDEGFSATRYHAGLDVEERAQNQDDFIYDRKRIMVATNAFGMGIDKGNVSFVLHYNMPKDMESYYQEAGRAGRDGNKAECILLFGEGDIATNKYLIEHANSEDDNIDNQYKLLYKMVDYCKTDNCLRAYILGYFGESYNGNCGNCGNCNSVNSEKVDCTKQAEVIVNCIKNLKRAYGISVIVSILKGGKDKNIVQGKLYNTPEYASMNTYSREEISAIIERMLDLKILERTGTVYPVIKVCDEFLNCDNLPSVFVSKNKIVGKKGKVQTTKTNTYVVSAEDEDVRNLLVILKGVRLEIAKRESMPAYIVFSDATLADMSKKMPINKDEFLSVSGVGEIKCNRYGDEFMQAIKTYLGIL